MQTRLADGMHPRGHRQFESGLVICDDRLHLPYTKLELRIPARIFTHKKDTWDSIDADLLYFPLPQPSRPIYHSLNSHVFKSCPKFILLTFIATGDVDMGLPAWNIHFQLLKGD